MPPPRCIPDSGSPSPSGLTWSSRIPKCTLNRDDHQTPQEATCHLFLRNGLICFENESKSNIVRCEETFHPGHGGIGLERWESVKTCGKCSKEGGHVTTYSKIQDSVPRRPRALCFPYGRSGWRLHRSPLQEILETKNVSGLFGNS